MPYTRPYSGGFVDYPSTTTPINATALNTMDVGIKTANDQFQTVTTAQRTALSPTVGQAVWDSDLKQLMVYMNASGGNAWQPVGNRIVCASTTRPSTPFHGQVIYETDTKKEFVYNGSAWVQTNTASTTSGVTGVSNLIVPPMVSATLTAQQSVNNTTWAFITYTSKVFDTDGMFTASDTKVTIQTAGVYLVTAQIGFATNATGDRLCKVEKNAPTSSNGTPLLSTFVKAITASDTHSTMTGIFNLAANDTLHVSVYQNSGGALNTATNPYPLLQAIWVGRTS